MPEISQAVAAKALAACRTLTNYEDGHGSLRDAIDLAREAVHLAAPTPPADLPLVRTGQGDYTQDLKG